jgi:hypothetical protein
MMLGTTNIKNLFCRSLYFLSFQDCKTPSPATCVPLMCKGCNFSAILFGLFVNYLIVNYVDTKYLQTNAACSEIYFPNCVIYLPVVGFCVSGACAFRCSEHKAYHYQLTILQCLRMSQYFTVIQWVGVSCAQNNPSCLASPCPPSSHLHSKA